MRSPLITAWRVLQYPIGLAVAAVISVIAALTLLGHVPLPLMHALVGFVGVFIGSLFFMPGSRRAGAVFLALIGIAFFYVRFVWHNEGHDRVPDPWLRLAFISAGAIVAVVSHTAWHSLSRRRTHDNEA